MQIVKPDAVSTTGYITRTGTATYYDSNGYLQTSTSGALRFGYHPTTLEFVGLIIEDASTNLLLQSNAFENASWTRININLPTANTVTAPTNTLAAEKLVPTTTPGYHSIYQQITASATVGQVYTFSVFAKANGYSWVRLQFDGVAGESSYCFFNLNTGTVGSTSGITGTPDVEVLKNGWYRVSITKSITTAGSLDASVYVQQSDNQTGNWAGDNTSGINLYGAQAELKSKMTSYISTTTTTASRAAEVITGSGLLYTSVTNPYSEWSSASVSYTVGQYVVVGTYNNATAGISTSSTASGTYRCLVNHTSSVSNGPLQSATNWVRVGPTNQFAMFDNVVSSVTSATTEFTFVIKSTSVDSIAVLNAVGNKIIAAVSDASYSETHLGNVAYYRTTQLSGTESIDWYSYFFFDEDTQKTQALFLDVPQEADGIITIRVTGSGTVSAGSVITGQIKEIGQTQYGVNTGIIDYSRKETDEFGNTTLVVRNYSKRMNAKVFLTNANLNRVQRLLYSIRATPVLWIGSTDSTFEEPLVVMGYYKDFDTEIAYPAHSLCNLSIEGLI